MTPSYDDRVDICRYLFSYFDLLQIELCSCLLSLKNNIFLLSYEALSYAVLLGPPQSSNFQKSSVMAGLNANPDGV